MALEITEIKTILKEPKNRVKLPKAVKHEARLRFHSESSLSKDFGQSNRFLEWVRTLIPKDKFKIFLSLFQYPLDTVRLTDETYQALEKVFDGRDPVFQLEFKDEETVIEAEEYLNDIIDVRKFIKTRGFNAMKNAINSIMVVDLPQEQNSTMPEPYVYILDIKNVRDYELTKDDNIDWLMFSQSSDTLAVYDDENYRVFKYNEGQELGEAIVDVKHDLGYCPANFFWTDSINYDNPELKRSPISNQLAQLDWILFYSISKKYGDLYAPWAIYWGIEQECNYGEDGETENGEHCKDGYVQNRDGIYLFDRDANLLPCPVCSNKIAGVGSFVDVPVPEEGQPLLTPPVGRVPVDKDSLEYNVAEVERLERNFYTSVTGNSLESVNDSQAINEQQVVSIYESRKSALLKLKVNFENAQKWIEETICSLRYGDNFISSYVNYGSEFYLFSAEEVMALYESARKSQLDHATLDLLQNQYYETKFRSNPAELGRMQVLLNLDPFRHLSNNEVKEMYDAGLIDKPDYYYKMNFSSSVMRFERENDSIEEFGSLLSYDKKIDNIKETLRGYMPSIETPLLEPVI